MSQNRATILVDVKPADTRGAFAPVTRDAKDLDRQLGEIARRLDSQIMRPLRNDPLAPMARSAEQVSRRMQDIARPIERIGAATATAARNMGGLQSSLDRAGTSASRLGGAFGNAAGGLTQLARGIAVFGGGNVEQAMQRLMAFTALADMGRGIGQIGSSVRGFFTTAGAQAAGQVAGQTAGSGVGTTVASSAVGTGIGHAALRFGGSALRFATPLAAAYAVGQAGYDAYQGDYGNAIAGRGTMRLAGSAAEWWSGRGTSDLGPAGVAQHMLARSAAGRTAAERLTAEGAGLDMRRQLLSGLVGWRAGIEGQRGIDAEAIAMRTRANRLADLEYQRQRGEAPGATSHDRMLGRRASMEILGTHAGDAVRPSAQAIAGRVAATRQREFFDSEIGSAQSALAGASGASAEERAVLEQRLLQLQQQRLQSVIAEREATNAVNQSLVAQATAREQILRTEHARARLAADAHRDETRNFGRELANASIEDRQRLLAISRQTGELSQEDEQFAGRFGAFGDIVRRQQDRRAGGADIQAILQNLGRNRRQSELDLHEQQASGAVTTAEGRTDAARAGAVAGMQQSLPAIERSVEEIVAQQGRLIAEHTNRLVQEALWRFAMQLNAGNGPNAGGE